MGYFWAKAFTVEHPWGGDPANVFRIVFQRSGMPAGVGHACWTWGNTGAHVQLLTKEETESTRLVSMLLCRTLNRKVSLLNTIWKCCQKRFSLNDNLSSTHVFGAQNSKICIFFPWRNFSFHFKRRIKAPYPLPHLQGGNRGIRDQKADWTKDEYCLNFTLWRRA